MCCYYDKEATKKLREKMKLRGGKMTAYKVYDRWAGGLCCICKDGFITSPGVITSNRESKVPGKDFDSVWGNDDIEISRGIHVELTRKGAIRWKRGGRRVIVPVTIEVKDLVGAGACGDAVFMKITISKRNFNKAM